MNKTIAYLRVSTDGQDLNNQKIEISDYCEKNGMKIDEWLEIVISSRKEMKSRRIDELLEKLNKGDTLIISELSRLGRSVGQIIMLIDELIKKKTFVVVIKQGIRITGERDITTTVMVTMLGLFAEIERDLISQRTKSGLIKARREGKILGRPKGPGKSKLDPLEEEIRGFRAAGDSKRQIARKLGISYSTLLNYIGKIGMG